MNPSIEKGRKHFAWAQENDDRCADAWGAAFHLLVVADGGILEEAVEMMIRAIVIAKKVHAFGITIPEEPNAVVAVNFINQHGLAIADCLNGITDEDLEDRQCVKKALTAPFVEWIKSDPSLRSDEVLKARLDLMIKVFDDRHTIIRSSLLMNWQASQ